MLHCGDQHHSYKLGKNYEEPRGKLWGNQQADLFHQYMTRLAERVCMDTSHTLSLEFQPLSSHSSRRYRYSKIRTSTAKKCFILN